MKDGYRKLMAKQHYRFIGSHSAVKLCTWTKKSLRKQGVCYKEKFYGIKSHRCCQLSVTMNYCDMDCIYCWREHYNEPFDNIDDPDVLVDEAVKAQRKLISGFGGYENVDMDKFKEAQNPNQFAISLTGETLYYPKLSEFVKSLKSKGHSTFIVTNGMLPEVMEKMEPPTQIYLSLDSPDKATQEKLCKPMRKDAWERLTKSLEVMKQLKDKTRTCLRITAVKGLNMDRPEGYAKLISIADPHFVEVKAYMYIGASRQRLTMENMPLHDDVRKFAEDIAAHCNYRIIDEHKPSRVILLMKEDFKGRIMESHEK